MGKIPRNKTHLWQADVLHGVEPVVYVVRVSKVEAVRLVLGLIFIVDFLERNLLRTEEVGQLGQIDPVS